MKTNSTGRIYRPVECFLWRDPRFASLSVDSKILWLYLLTSPHSLPIPGWITATRIDIVLDLGWWSEDDPDALPDALSRFVAAFEPIVEMGWAREDRSARVVMLPKAVRRRLPISSKNVIGWFNSIREIPKTDLMSVWAVEALRILRQEFGSNDPRVATFKSKFAEALRVEEGPENNVPNNDGNNDRTMNPTLHEQGKGKGKGKDRCVRPRHTSDDRSTSSLLGEERVQEFGDREKGTSAIATSLLSEGEREILALLERQFGDRLADMKTKAIADLVRDLNDPVAYPGVNPLEQISKAGSWERGQRQKKTAAGLGRFLRGWLGRASGGARQDQKTNTKSGGDPNYKSPSLRPLSENQD